MFGVVAGHPRAGRAFFAVLLIIRLLYVYLPIHPLSRRIWIADAIAAAIFLGVRSVSLADATTTRKLRRNDQ